MPLKSGDRPLLVFTEWLAALAAEKQGEVMIVKHSVTHLVNLVVVVKATPVGGINRLLGFVHTFPARDNLSIRSQSSFSS